MVEILRKHPFITVVTIVITGLLIWGFLPQAIPVEALQAHRAPLTITIEEEGKTRVIDRYIISAPVDGITCRLKYDVGDEVKQDQVLMSITPLQSQILDPRSRAQAEAQVAAARAALSSAEQQFNSAKAAEALSALELERLKPLLAKGLIARDAYDRASTDAHSRLAEKRSAGFNVEVAQYELKAAQSVLDVNTNASDNSPERIPVSSPINGKVLKVNHECEGPVRTGEALLEVGDPQALEVEVDVLSADAVRIKPGMDVVFDHWGGEQHLTGVVRVVEPVGFTKVSALGVEEQRVLIIADFHSPNSSWQKLGDGYRVVARFILWHHEDVLQIPTSSLFQSNQQWAAFVVENGKAVKREVSIGKRNGLAAEVLSGIVEGERVINHPPENVDDGVRVEILSFK
jgi:HlyD family secretion protein